VTLHGIVTIVRLIAAALALIATVACNRGNQPAERPIRARNLLLITIDTLRADRVGAYGYAAARTPAIDALAARGVRYEHAYATAPITLTSHASLLTGMYPPAHSARHNGMHLNDNARTLAQGVKTAGFSTGAFVGAFPLDRRFGLDRGFDVYSDLMPRGRDGRPANERPARIVADEAIDWLAKHRSGRFFLWIHFFEPHAPYGNPADGRPASQRYDDEVAEADRQAQRILSSLGTDQASTLVVLTADHGEAFGEHGEIGHSVFVYDTTLRVPLMIAGPGVNPRIVSDPVSLVDIAPTVMRALDLPAVSNTDGIDLTPERTASVPSRDRYAESFAPLLDFGWSPLRSMRSGNMKYIAAPKPELYDLTADPSESVNLVQKDPQRAAALEARIERISPPTLDTAARADDESRRRLGALGYIATSRTSNVVGRADPKDRRELAARIAQVTSGELNGPALEEALRAILRDDPQNPQAHLRLGYVLAESNGCKDAEPHFRAAISARMPTADAHLGLAGCYANARNFAAAAALLRDAAAIEPGNPVVIANQGVLLSDSGRPADAIPLLQRALSVDPDFHEARFNLAIAFARANRRAEAASEARELLARMAADAPQRSEVQRLLDAVR
jgi:arylsulfatase A-like enzyme/cytochrome c-type biogenesis protein CcmH/NrfG